MKLEEVLLLLHSPGDTTMIFTIAGKHEPFNKLGCTTLHVSHPAAFRRNLKTHFLH